MNKTTIFNNENMLKFLDQFDVIRNKYFWWEGRKAYSILSINTAMDPFLYGQAAIQNGSQSMPLWNNDKATEAYKTVKTVYDDYFYTGQLGVIQIATEKLLGEFVRIDGLEHLFKGSYFSFEWRMHLEYIQERDKISHYRDHYIHQVRNMYQMLCLLSSDYVFWEICKNTYLRGNNIVSRCVQSSIGESLQASFEHEFWDDNAKGLLDLYSKNKIEPDFYYNYLIYSTAIVAALIHDIGYPLGYMEREADLLHKFLPVSDAFITEKDPMPHFTEVLKRSLLFETEDNDEIAKRINDKRDHGALSAVILLSQYYENGEIYGMHPIKRMVIDLSALVIYNHTKKYSVMTGNKESNHRNMFARNPLSYLFRLCDDIQEWSRVYFSVNKSSNILVCDKCHMPITFESGRGNNSIGRIYSCGCMDNAEKATSLEYRKLMNMVGCENVEIRGYGENNLIIHFDFDLIRLLQLSMYDSHYARQRGDGLYEVKRMLEEQGADFPQIYVEGFVSPNPISIKVEILREYLSRNPFYGKKRSGNVRDNVKEILAGKDEEVTDDFMKTNGKKKESYGIKKLAQYLLRQLKNYTLYRNSKQSKRTYIYWQDSLIFYTCLYLIGGTINSVHLNHTPIAWEKIIADIEAEISRSFHISHHPTRELILDYLRQQYARTSEGEFFSMWNDSKSYYFREFLYNESISQTVDDYIKSDIYTVIKEQYRTDQSRPEGIYDYFSDYKMFEKMASL